MCVCVRVFPSNTTIKMFFINKTTSKEMILKIRTGGNASILAAPPPSPSPCHYAAAILYFSDVMAYARMIKLISHKSLCAILFHNNPSFSGFNDHLVCN